MKKIEVYADKTSGDVTLFESLSIGYDFQTVGLKGELSFTWHPWGWKGLNVHIYVLFLYIILDIGVMSEWKDTAP